MTNASPWDDPELKQGEFYSFDNPGDIASGVIQSVGIHRWDDGKVSPQIKMVDDNGEIPLGAFSRAAAAGLLLAPLGGLLVHLLLQVLPLLGPQAGQQRCGQRRGRRRLVGFRTPARRAARVDHS